MSQPSPLAAAQRTAQELHDSGDLPGACRVLANAIDAVRAAYGADHPEVLGGAYLLARYYRAGDDPTAARRVLEEALAAAERRWSESDPLLLAISFELGQVAEELGNRHEARRNFTRVATTGAEVLGVDHPAVRAARAYLGDSPSSGMSLPAVPAPGVTPTSPEVGAVPPISGPPVSAHPISGPPVSSFPTSGPPVSGPAISAPPFSAPPSSAPPFSAPPGPYPPGGGVPPVWSAPAPAGGVRGRGTLIASIVAAITSVTALALVVVVLLRQGDGPDPAGSDRVGPSTALAAPTGVTLEKEAGGVTLAWDDPSDGEVPFVVTGGRAGGDGESSRQALAQVEAGTTRYTVHGLNPDDDYCFTVTAIYSAREYAVSDPACTERGSRRTR